jgi:predicted transcriptional regulator
MLKRLGGNSMKRVRIEIKSEREFIEDLMKIAEKIDRGEAEPTDEMVLSFENFEVFYRSITPDRLNLINVIKQNEPIEIEDLAELVGMNTESLIEELRELEILGLVEFDNSKVRVPYEEIVISLKMKPVIRKTSKLRGMVG